MKEGMDNEVYLRLIEVAFNSLGGQSRTDFLLDVKKEIENSVRGGEE